MIVILNYGIWSCTIEPDTGVVLITNNQVYQREYMLRVDMYTIEQIKEYIFIYEENGSFHQFKFEDDFTLIGDFVSANGEDITPFAMWDVTDDMDIE